jgi:DNA-binding MarR family transcriptional regulator
MRSREARIRQIETSLESRVVIEQAKGRLAERFELEVDDAFALLRATARANRLTLRALAQAVVEHPGSTPTEIVATLARPDLWQIPAPSRLPGLPEELEMALKEIEALAGSSGSRPERSMFRLRLGGAGLVLGTREEGAAASARLRDAYAGEPTIVFDFEGVEAATMAYLSELLSAVASIVAERGEAAGPVVVATGVVSDVEPELEAVLARENRYLALADPAGVRLVPANPHLTKVLQAAQGLEAPFTAAELAARLGVNPTSLNERLAPLVRAGVFSRERDQSAQRGKRYRYRVPTDELARILKEGDERGSGDATVDTQDAASQLRRENDFLSRQLTHQLTMSQVLLGLSEGYGLTMEASFRLLVEAAGETDLETFVQALMKNQQWAQQAVGVVAARL